MREGEKDDERGQSEREREKMGRKQRQRGVGWASAERGVHEERRNRNEEQRIVMVWRARRLKEQQRTEERSKRNPKP